MKEKKGTAFIPSTLMIIILVLGLPFFILRESLYFTSELSILLYLAGKYFGLSAFILFTLQYIWTARFHFFERFLPYDRRVAIHRTLGFTGFLFLILHPLFIMVSYNITGRSIYMALPIYLGFLSLLLILVIVASTFLGRIWQVPFESWKIIHFTTFAILTLAFIHSLWIGSDFYGLNRFLWIFIWCSHAIILFGKAYSKIRTWNHKYTVKKIIIENPGTTTLTLDKPETFWKAGQFTFLSLKRNNKWESWHPFSIISNPEDDNLSVTIKSLGDFTNTISKTSVGDPVKLNPGFGGFTLDRHRDEKYTFIAGGVGITPIYSLLKELHIRDDNYDVKLIYTAHHESELLFRKELETWFDDHENWQLTFVVTSQPDWKGVKGRLTNNKVLEICENDLTGTFFLCGPMLLVKSLTTFLKTEGVSKRNIVTEYFVFLP